MSEIRHTTQRFRIIFAELRLASHHHLHFEVLSIVPPALGPKRRRQVTHAGQCIRMVLPEYCFASLHCLNLQLLGLFPPALFAVPIMCVGVILAKFSLASRYYLHISFRRPWLGYINTRLVIFVNVEGMSLAKLYLANFHYTYGEMLGVLLSTLVRSVQKYNPCQILFCLFLPPVYRAAQLPSTDPDCNIGMALTERFLIYLYDLHEKPLGLIPLTLKPVSCCQQVCAIKHSS
ncbi:hypothetical protein VI817_007152 [Penicillium citrinum]|nr:hypothetical protein VI817_007152 [Penicillium citrinum]